jgi:hypothetical protein
MHIRAITSGALRSTRNPPTVILVGMKMPPSVIVGVGVALEPVVNSVSDTTSVVYTDSNVVVGGDLVDV